MVIILQDFHQLHAFDEVLYYQAKLVYLNFGGYSI